MKWLALTAVLLFAAPLSAQTVAIDPNTSHQTWIRFEARAVIGQNNPANTDWRNWKKDLIAKAVDIGVDGVRLEITSGVENDADYYALWWAGTIDTATHNAHWYDPINDNADPNVIDPSKFHWTLLDDQMEFVLELKAALAAVGKKLWISLCVVDFQDSTFDFQDNPNEYAELVLAAFHRMQAKHGAAPDSLEILLEPDSGPDQWTAAQVADAAVAARTRLLAAGFTPYFIGPSTTSAPNSQTFYSAMKAHDANSVASIQEISRHSYVQLDNTDLAALATFAATEGKKTSMLELGPPDGASYGAGLDSNWGVFHWWKFAKDSAFEQFSWGSTDPTDNGGKLFIINQSTEAITYGSRTQFLKQMFKYLDRGAVRKGSSTTDTDFDCLPWLNPDGTYTVPCRALSAGTFTTTGLPNGTYHRRYTDSDEIDQAMSDVTVSGGSPSFSTTMDDPGIVVFYQDPPGPFYFSTTGSGTTCSLASPCSVDTALSGNSGAIKPGTFVYGRGGTYNTKVNITLSGTADAPVIIRPYPGEWAKIDGFVTTTTTQAIDTDDTTVTVTDASKFKEGYTINFHDAAQESQEETAQISDISGNTLTLTRAWNGTTATSHSSGATIVLGGNNVTYTGSDFWFTGFEVTNSDPTRTWDNANGQAGPHNRGECIFELGDRTKTINNILHGCQDGIFTGAGAEDTESYGNIILNNGYVDTNGGAGHGLYTINNAPSFKHFVENSLLNNMFFGAQHESVTGDTENIINSGNVIAGNAQGGMLIGAASGITDNVMLSRSFGYFPSENGIRLGYNGISNGAIQFTENYFASLGGTAVEARDWNSIVSFHNTFVTDGPTSVSAAFIDQPGSTTYVWDFNRLYDVSNIWDCTGTDSSAVLVYNAVTGACGSWLKFSEWVSNTTFDDNTTDLGGSTPSDHNGYFFTTTAAPNKITVLPNQYEPNWVKIVVYNWTGASSVNVDLTNIVASGFEYEIYPDENPMVAVASGTYTTGNVSIPMTGSAVLNRIGLSQPASTRPTFQSFMFRSPINAEAPPDPPQDPGGPTRTMVEPRVRVTRTGANRTIVTRSAIQ